MCDPKILADSAHAFAPEAPKMFRVSACLSRPPPLLLAGERRRAHWRDLPQQRVNMRVRRNAASAREKKFSSRAGNRTPVSSVTARDTNHYTTRDSHIYMGPLQSIDVWRAGQRASTAQPSTAKTKRATAAFLADVLWLRPAAAKNFVQSSPDGCIVHPTLERPQQACGQTWGPLAAARSAAALTATHMPPPPQLITVARRLGCLAEF